MNYLSRKKPMPFQTSNDITLYYEQQGNGEDLILIGGLSADHNVWKTSLNILTKYSFIFSHGKYPFLYSLPKWP